MLFVDGKPLRQVADLASVKPGTFFADYPRSRLYIGDDPAGKQVEASVLDQALVLSTSAAGSLVRGLTFEHFSPNFDYPNLAMVVGFGPDLVFENNTFSHSASRGLTIFGEAARVEGNTFRDNGLVGLHGHRAHGARILKNLVTTNNNERFPSGTVVTSSGGIKLTASRGLLISGNVVEDNTGSGIWCDLSCYDTTIVSNRVENNSGSGIFFEVSGKAIVASNVIMGNGIGLKLSGATDVQAYNNTFVDNRRQVGVYEDARRNMNPEEVGMGITWDTARIRLFNGIMSSSSPLEMVHTMDNNNPNQVGASDMVIAMDYNSYHRRSDRTSGILVRWAREGRRPSIFRTLASLRTRTGREENGFVHWGKNNPFFVDQSKGDYNLKEGSPARGSGTPLPPEVALAIGVQAGMPVDRGALRWPGQ